MSDRKRENEKMRKPSSSGSSHHKSPSDEKHYKHASGKAPATEMPPKYNRIRVQDLLNAESGSSAQSKNENAGKGHKKGSSSRTPPPEYPFNISCDLPNCGSQFYDEDALINHKKRSHAEPTAFICQHCYSSFSTSTNLTKHVRSVHEKLKPFSCNKCRADFSFRDGLYRHIQMVHDQVRAFPCSLCPQRFKTKAHLLKHINTVHITKTTHKSVLERKGPGSSSRG